MTWVQKLIVWWVSAILLALLADEASGHVARIVLSLMAGASLGLPVALLIFDKE